MARADFAFFHRLRVRYAEIDAQAVVFNPRYLDYADVGISEYFRWLGIPIPPAPGAPEFHTARATVEYKAPIRLDEEIDIGVRVTHIGRTSLRLGLEIHGRDAENLRAAIELVYVHVDLGSGRPVAVPPGIVELMRGRAGAGAEG